MAMTTATTTTPSSSTIQRLDRSLARRRGRPGRRPAVECRRRRPAGSSASMAREVLPGLRPVRSAVTSRAVSRPRGRMDVVSAVIFDFYGTLAHWADHDGHELRGGVRRLRLHARPGRPPGLLLPLRRDRPRRALRQRGGLRGLGQDRLRDSPTACGVHGRRRRAMSIDALRDSDRAGWSPTPRRRRPCRPCAAPGLAVGVCSNWGWELDGFLDQVGLLHLVDAGVTSARAGSRKPHPGIYARSAESLGVDPRAGRLRR